ncbi:hypothetical protein B0H16DRAFT_1474286 [Mycena metata]|uniref:Uncharacterized protein n=1 Tax=Mycena metata TaxID=1033252 RepID=A0AAD7MJP7_9AGAR|nr:hypothetical protein B0H16DRAFT_1474286 [Mycena metata]
MNRPDTFSAIPCGYEPTDADMANPVVHSLCSMLKHTESKLHGIQRAKIEYEVVTNTQLSRLRLKLAEAKKQLKDARDGMREFETRVAGALCEAVIDRQNRKRLDTMQKEFSCGICLEVLNAPDVQVCTPILDSVNFAAHRARQSSGDFYELESAIEALVKAGVFQRAQAVNRVAGDYDRYFPSYRAALSSGSGVHRRSRQLQPNRSNNHFHYARRTPLSHASRRVPVNDDMWDPTAW